jgi:DNA polymerase kappa
MKTTSDPPLQEETPGKEHGTLKYSLLGPSLTKSGQENVDQTKVWLNKSHEAIV